MTAGVPTVNPYLKTKVLTASPEELRLMLLDGAIKFAQQGREAMAEKDFEGTFTGMSQARDIVMELITTVHDEVDPELGAKVRSVYTFIYTQLMEASFEKDPVKVEKAIELLRFERETWALAMQKLVEERQAGTLPMAQPAPTPGKPAAADTQNAPRPRLSIQG